MHLSREEEETSILGHQETTFEGLAGLVSPLLVETATLVILPSESLLHLSLLLMNR